MFSQGNVGFEVEVRLRPPRAQKWMPPRLKRHLLEQHVLPFGSQGVPPNEQCFAEGIDVVNSFVYSWMSSMCSSKKLSSSLSSKYSASPIMSWTPSLSETYLLTLILPPILKLPMQMRFLENFNFWQRPLQHSLCLWQVCFFCLQASAMQAKTTRRTIILNILLLIVISFLFCDF